MEFGSPQPFVPLYAVVLGKGGHIFMNIICIVALWLVRQTPCIFIDPLLTPTEYRHRHHRRIPARLRRRP